MVRLERKLSIRIPRKHLSEPIEEITKAIIEFGIDSMNRPNPYARIIAGFGDMKDSGHEADSETFEKLAKGLEALPEKTDRNIMIKHHDTLVKLARLDWGLVYIRRDEYKGALNKKGFPTRRYPYYAITKNGDFHLVSESKLEAFHDKNREKILLLAPFKESKYWKVSTVTPKRRHLARA